MKKFIILLALSLFVLVFLSVPISAQVEEGQEASPSVEATESAMEKETDYELPYPGMLPDQPLYKLKVLRDKITLFFIRDPMKKAARHLQQADKEFMMALKLAEKEKMPLAQHTAFKAEHHMTLLMTEIKRGVYSGNEFDQGLVDRVHQAALKHQDVLAGMMARANEEEGEAIKTIIEFSQRNDQTLDEVEAELKAGEEEK